MNEIDLEFDEEAKQKKDHAAAYRKKDCAFCNEKIDQGWGEMTIVGTMHRKCVLPWKRDQAMNKDRCTHCDAFLEEKRMLKGKAKLHPDCVDEWKAKKPWIKPTKMGIVDKFAMGRSTFGKKNWKTRHVVISPDIEGTGGIAYWEDLKAYETKKPPKNSLKIGELVRMVSRPNTLCHAACTSANNEICLIFPTPEVTKVDSNAKDHRLLLRFSGLQEKEAYLEVLKKYVRIIDYPDDYLHREKVFVK